MDWIQSQNWQLKISSAFTHKQERVIITAQLKWPKKLQFSHTIHIPIWLFLLSLFSILRIFKIHSGNPLSLSLWFSWKERVTTTASKSQWVIVKCFTTPQEKTTTWFLVFLLKVLVFHFWWNAWTIWTGSNLISYFV